MKITYGHNCCWGQFIDFFEVSFFGIVCSVVVLCVGGWVLKMCFRLCGLVPFWSECTNFHIIYIYIITQVMCDRYSGSVRPLLRLCATVTQVMWRSLLMLCALFTSFHIYSWFIERIFFCVTSDVFAATICWSAVVVFENM